MRVHDNAAIVWPARVFVAEFSELSLGRSLRPARAPPPIYHPCCLSSHHDRPGTAAAATAGRRAVTPAPLTPPTPPPSPWWLATPTLPRNPACSVVVKATGSVGARYAMSRALITSSAVITHSLCTWGGEGTRAPTRPARRACNRGDALTWDANTVSISFHDELVRHPELQLHGARGLVPRVDVAAQVRLPLQRLR